MPSSCVSVRRHARTASSETRRWLPSTLPDEAKVALVDWVDSGDHDRARAALTSILRLRELGEKSIDDSCQRPIGHGKPDDGVASEGGCEQVSERVVVGPLRLPATGCGALSRDVLWAAAASPLARQVGTRLR